MEELIRTILIFGLVSAAAIAVFLLIKAKLGKPKPPIDNGDCVRYTNLSDDRWEGSYTNCNDEYIEFASLNKHESICVKEGTVITSTSVVELTINGRC